MPFPTFIKEFKLETRLIAYVVYMPGFGITIIEVC